MIDVWIVAFNVDENRSKLKVSILIKSFLQSAVIRHLIGGQDLAGRASGYFLLSGFNSLPVYLHYIGKSFLESTGRGRVFILIRQMAKIAHEKCFDPLNENS